MESLGQYLTSLREERNLSVEKVSAEIRLSVSQLTNIENNQLSQFGNYGLARAMVYTYIRFLEADEKTAMYLFDQILPPQVQTQFFSQTPLKEKKVLISTNFIWLITIILIVIILGTIILISYNKGYLRRPFDSIKTEIDTIKIAVPKVEEQVKQDTLRMRLLQIAKESEKPQSIEKSKKKVITKKPKSTVIDTTDYVNGLLFNDKESPFNQRF
jgi:cytoskeletal protein RodZ